MHSLEIFNRYTMAQSDHWSMQEFRQNYRGNLLEKRVSCLEAVDTLPRDAEYDLFHSNILTKKLHIRIALQAGKGPSPSLTVCSARSVKTIYAGNNSSQAGQHNIELAENGPPNAGSYTYLGKATDREELAAIRESAMRSKLLQKLSEANQYGRHLRRQLREKEDALMNCKSELAIMETEIQALVALAQEAAREGAKPGSRKINGKYIQSHLALRLEELHERLLAQVKDIDAVRYREVPLVWYGMAEDVQVMGTFDGWTQGEQMSPENTGSFNKFSTTLKLRPGRYEIKFLVDGEWQISRDWPTVGEGMTMNNVLVVE